MAGKPLDDGQHQPVWSGCWPASSIILLSLLSSVVVHICPYAAFLQRQIRHQTCMNMAPLKAMDIERSGILTGRSAAPPAGAFFELKGWSGLLQFVGLLE